MDFRGKGGLAVVIGWGRSITGSITPPLPDWLQAVVSTGSEAAPERADGMPLTNEKKSILLTLIEEAEEGNRNALLYWAACRMWDGYFRLPVDQRPPSADVRAAMVTRAMRAGLGEAEARATVNSAERTVKDAPSA